MPLEQRVEKPGGLRDLVLGVYLINTIFDLVGCFVEQKEGEGIWLILKMKRS